MKAASAPWPYDQWGRVTRFLESGRVAFARERALWSSSNIAQPELVTLSVPKADQGTYRVRLAQHLAALEDEQTFYAAVLIQSYAIAQAAAADQLATDAQALYGIERWGTELLEQAGSSWDQVRDGLAGAVETAIVRNTLAHATRSVTARAAARAQAAGVSGMPAGTIVELDYPQLLRHRSRLLSLLRRGHVAARAT